MKNQKPSRQTEGANRGSLHAVVMPRSWKQFKWPRFVPPEVRATIADFWNPKWGRNPQKWREGTVLDPYNNQPELGEKVTVKSMYAGHRQHTGKWVPCWNNIGRIICRGKSYVAGTCDIVKRHNEKAVPPSGNGRGAQPKEPNANR